MCHFKSISSGICKRIEYMSGPLQAGGLGGLRPLQFLADQFTLSRPGWAPNPTSPPGFSDLVTALHVYLPICGMWATYLIYTAYLITEHISVKVTQPPFFQLFSAQFLSSHINICDKEITFDL